MAVPSPVQKSQWDCVRNEAMRRRVFWTTQLNACGEYVLCGHECAIPGLIYEDHDEQDDDMGIPDAPADGKMYVRKDRQWVVMPSGFSTSFEFTFDNAITAPPNNSQMRFDNANPVLVTKVWLHNSDADSIDVSNFLMLIQEGFVIFIQDKNDPTKACRFKASGPVNKLTGYCEIPVSYTASTGALVDNQRVVLLVYGGG